MTTCPAPGHRPGWVGGGREDTIILCPSVGGDYSLVLFYRPWVYYMEQCSHVVLDAGRGSCVLNRRCHSNDVQTRRHSDRTTARRRSPANLLRLRLAGRWVIIPGDNARRLLFYQPYLACGRDV